MTPSETGASPHWPVRSARGQGLGAQTIAEGRPVHQDDDPWLLAWLPLIAQHASGTCVLELGCGDGRDTEALVSAGQAVIAIDRDAEALARAKRRAPQALYLQRDLRAPLPLAPRSVGVVLASLCLHYFPWPETRDLIRRFAQVLRPGGLLIGRANSINDHNHGASGHPQIAENFYFVGGRTKRFFDRESIETLLRDDWQTLTLNEQVIYRYEKPKAVWEFVATSTGGSS